MKLKVPLVLDCWEANVVRDWNCADGYIFCASWRRLTEDAGFGPNWQVCTKPKAAFYAFYPDVSAADQAKKFAGILKKYGYNGEPLWIDAEVGTFTLKQIIDFSYNLEQLTGTRPGVYSWAWKVDGLAGLIRESVNNVKLALQAYALTPTDAAYLKTMPFWGAGWPDNPDLFDAPPTSYVSKRFGPTVVWQYAGDLNPAALGLPVTGGVDLDWVNVGYWAEWLKLGGSGTVQSVPWHECEGAPSELQLTPSENGVLEYQSLHNLVTTRGWRAGMNAGAGGQDAGDKVHFFCYGTSAYRGKLYSRDDSYQSIYINASGGLTEIRPSLIYTAVPYSRKAVLPDGSLNAGLDAVKVAGWNLMGMHAGKLIMLVTEGREGEAGYTQAEAAAFAKSRGLCPAWLCDSGHPLNYHDENTDYSAYGEPVQFAIGFPVVQNGGATVATKAVCKVTTNIKVTSGINPSPLPVLPVGGVVYGTRAIVLGVTTDIVGFDHYYDATGNRIALTAVSKVSYSGSNLVLTDNVTEPGITPPPPPPVGVTLKHTIRVFSDGTIQVDDGPIA